MKENVTIIDRILKPSVNFMLGSSQEITEIIKSAKQVFLLLQFAEIGIDRCGRHCQRCCRCQPPETEWLRIPQATTRIQLPETGNSFRTSD